MTRKEYAQSMLDQGKTKEQTIELVKQWDIDNKPTEVEKPQATATDAAPVVASPTDSTESSSEDTSLDSQKNENDPENLGKKDIKEEKKSKGKIKVPKNSENIPEGKYDVIETYDLTSLNDEEKTKIQNSFNRKNVDLSNIAEDADKLKNQSEPLTRLEEDTDRRSGNLVSLKKINYNYTEPETKKRINRPGEDKESTVETSKGNYYIAYYKQDKKNGFFNFNTAKEIQGDTPIYLTFEQEEELFGKKDDVVTTDQVTIRDPKDETLKEVVVTAESSLIPANPSEIINEINVIDQELNDPETTPERVEELKEFKNSKKTKLVQAYRNNNMLSSIEVEQEKPKPTDWTGKGGYFNNTDNGYEIKTEKDYGQTGIFGRKKKLEKNIREFENLESDAVRDSINEKYINNGIGAIRDGGDVYVYKNPVFKDDGSLDYRKTLEANGMSADLMPDYSKRSKALYETNDFNRLMKSKDLFYKANFGIGGNNVEDVEGVTNFIDKNISEYKKSNSTAPGAKADSSKERKEKKKTLNLIKENINEQKSNIQQRTKIILDTSKISEDITKQKTSLRKEFVRSNEEIRLIEEENKKIKKEIDNGSNVQNKKVDQLKKDIADNPDLSKQLIKEYRKWEKGFMSDQKESIKTYNNNLEKEKSISSKYKNFYDNKIPNIKSLTTEYNAEVGGFTKLKDEFDGLLSDNDFLTALEGEYTASNLMLSGRLEKMSEEYEAQGSYIRELYNTVAGQVAETSVGRVQAFQLFARGINYLGHEIYSSGSPDFIKKAFGINDRQYKSYKQRFAFENASIDNNIKAIKDQLQLSGNDEKFSQEFAQSLVGGTINSFAQMYGAVIGAPLTGLAGGYFFGTLAAEQADAVRVENEFIADHPELSRSEAKKRFDEIWSPASRQGYALAKATVQGALSYVTAGIMKGNIKITEKVVGRVTNSVMKNLTGNVTAKDIQIAVNKKIGDLSAKALSKFGKVTGSGIDELLDETVQTGADYFITEMFNKGTGNQLNFELPAYTSDEFKKEMKHMAGVSFLSGNAGGSFQAMINSEQILSDYDANNSFAERKQFEKNMEELANTLRSPEDLSVALTQIKEQIGQEVNGEIYTQEQFDEDAFEMNKAFSRFNKIDPNINGKAQMEVAQLLKANEDLEVQAEKLGPNTNARVKKQIEANNKQIQEITTDSNNEISKELTAEEQLDFTEKQLKIVSLQKIKNLAKDQDISKEDADNLLNEAKVEVFNDENVDEIAEKYNLNKEDLLDPEGVYLKDKGVILMSKTATKGVLEHESLHNFLDIALSDPKNKNVVFGIAEALKKQMAEIDPETARKIERQLDKYRSDENYTDADVAEEVLTYYTQLKKKGAFKKGTTIGGEVKAGVRRLFQGLGMEIEINENNVMEVLDDYIRNTGRGKLTRSQRKLAKGKVKFSDIIKKSGDLIASENDAKVIPINKQSETTTEDIKSRDTKMAAAKPISVDTRSMSDAFDQNITEELKTNEDFKNSEAAIDAFENIENNSQFDNYINQLINRDNNLQGLDSNVKQEVNRKIKENLQLRALNNFKPIVDGNKRSLFSYLYGKADQRGLGGVAQKALLDVKKDYATRVDSDARSIDKPTSEGQAFDIEDKSTDIIEQVDRGVAKQPKSTFRRNIKRGNEKGLTQEEVKSFKEISEPIVSKLPPVSDPKYRTRVDQLAGAELKNWVKDNVLKGQDYKTFVRENYNNIRDLDLKYLIELDKGLMKQGKPRMFTKPNRRLTTQADIRKYRDSGRAFVENEAQGVMLYDILNPGADAAVDFFTKEKPSTVSNRKGKLAEAFGKKMFKDFLPESRAKQGDTDQVKATSARKTQTRPDILFAKKLDGLDLDLNQKQKNSFKKKVEQVVDNNPGVTLEQAIEYEAKAIGRSKGFAYENVIIRRLKELNIKGFEVSDQAGGNKVGIPDFAAKIFGNNFDVEVKLAKAQYGDVGLTFRNSLIDFNNKVKSKDYSFKERIRTELFKPSVKALAAYRKRAGELGADLELYDRTGKLPTEIFLQLGEGLDAKGISKLKPKYKYLKEKFPNGIKGEGLQKAVTQKAEFDITPIKEIYENKTPPTNYIQLKDSGLFFMGKNPLGLPIPELTGNVDLNMRIFPSNNVGKDGVPTTTVNLRILPSNLRNIPKSDYTLDNTSSVSSLMKTEAVKMLEVKIPAKQSNIKELSNEVVKFSKTETNDDIVNYAATVDEALRLANSLDQPVKKIRVFDFDDTLATTKSDVLFTAPDGKEGRLNAEQFAKQGAQLLEEGYVFDFSEFNKVTKGKPGPLLDIAKKIQDARGTQDVFVLTARNPAAQVAIKEFLDSQGLDIPLENITGLGDSTGAAKAKWMVNKAAEGYNDFYFADDAYQNVKAVRDVMSVIDVKSKVQQARVKESKKLSDEFNDLIDETTGVDAFKEYSAAKAKTIGASKGNFKFFIPYSAEDFLGLVYPTLAKGSKGDAQMAWYKTNLIDKYTKAQENLSTARLNLMNDFKQLKKSLDVPKDLKKKNSNGFTNEQAVRVYLWNKADVEIPGLSKRDLKQLSDTVQNNSKLREFAEQILSITKGDGYAMPDANWLVGTITTDLINLINTEKRSKYLTDWQESVDAIYSKENLNKLEAIYGTKYVEALTNMLTRMKTGKNRLTSGSKIENRILDYVNGSIGTIMFFNTRSAVLQTISSINFVNWSFNNPYQAGKAFANQKQYWSDFKELMNSDYLLDRRNGLKLNISESEIADAAATSKNKAKAAINYLLQKGFLPTQYADSFAIASGGATFYRNRIKDLVSKGMTEVDAKKQALIEFRQVAEESQQSSDPSRISQQQASNIGRLILAFANTPMQYARIQKRAIQDLINGRGDAKSHVSRIVYYGFVQNVIFNALQQAVFALGFGDDDDDDDEKEEAKNKKYLNVANGMLDSLLRGLGIGGAAVSVAKNFLMDIYERSGRDRPEYVDSVWEVTRFSPPIYSKLSKLKQAGWQFDSKKRRELIYEKGFSLDNPAYEAAAKVVSATTNVPLDRVMYKIKNIEGALDEDNEIWQRIAMMGGWPKWQLEDPKTPATLTPEEKTEKKANTKIENYKKAKGSKDYDTIKKLTSDQQIKMLKGLGFGEYTIKKAKSEDAKIKLIIAKNSGKKDIVNKKEVDAYKYKKLSKADQVRKLDSLGLSKDEIKALKYENDRVEKLLELMD
jgi:hypothetical protein